MVQIPGQEDGDCEYAYHAKTALGAANWSTATAHTVSLVSASLAPFLHQMPHGMLPYLSIQRSLMARNAGSSSSWADEETTRSVILVATASLYRWKPVSKALMEARRDGYVQPAPLANSLSHDPPLPDMVQTSFDGFVLHGRRRRGQAEDHHRAILDVSGLQRPLTWPVRAATE